MNGVRRVFAFVLAAALTLGALPLPKAAAATDAVTVTKSVSPTEILVQEEVEVTLTVQGTPPTNVVRPNDVILVIDRSGSMASEGRMTSAKNAAKGFVDLMDFSKHRVGIVDYSTTAKGMPLTTDGEQAKQYIDTLVANGNTATGDAIQLAMELLAEHRPEAQPVIVLMTDGEANVGSPTPYDYAKLKAAEAKAAGIVFYTIALLSKDDDPETSPPNLLLKEMATTAQHHHFVLGAQDLSTIYSKIVHEIGIASAYDVTLTETVSGDFEIVPDSYQHNIPQPQVSGNTLTWHFLELKDEALTFTYRIRHKDGGATGMLPTSSGSSLTYKDYAGAPRTGTVPVVRVKVSYPAPVIESVEPDNGPVSGGNAVVIRGRNFRPGATVTFGNYTAANPVVTPTEITVTAPAVTKAGAVTLQVTNDDQQKAAATYTYWVEPELQSLTPAEGPLTGGTAVRIKGRHFANGAQVRFGDVPAAQVTYIDAYNLDAITPPGTAAGPVSVTVENPDGHSTTLADGFTYLPLDATQPEITAITPPSGSMYGGETVVIEGRNFADGATVTFGGTPAAKVTVESSDRIVVTTPAASAGGTVEVVVTNPNGQYATGSYLYMVPAPTITNVSPTSGSVYGGTIVYVDGTHFQSGAVIYFGDQQATILNYYGPTRMRVRTPESNVGGGVPVRLVNPDGQEAVWSGLFEYILPDPPSISAIEPAEGSVDGGEAVTIKGANFAAGSRVFFGAAEATVVNITAAQITVTTPPAQGEGAVDVRVVDRWGQEGVLPGGYTYIVPPPAPAPQVTSLSPDNGELAGGELIYVNGAYFDPAVRIFFGSNEAVVLNYYGPDRLRVKAPAAANPGAVDVRAENPDGQVGVLPAGYTYNAPPEDPDPTVTNVTPSEGPMEGGTLVYVEGTEFASEAIVMFGSNQAQVLNYYGSTRMRVRVPASDVSGPVDVTVINPSGKQAVLPDGFTYLAPPPPPDPELIGLSADSGLVVGGEIVYVDGANLDSDVQIFFGNVQATVMNYYGPTRVRVRVPAAPAPGVVDVIAVNPKGGKSAVLPQAYTYLPVSVKITSLSPNEGEMAGGEIVYIYGEFFTERSEFYFGSTPVTVLNYYGPTYVRVRAPASTVPGPVDVTVVADPTDPNTTTFTLSGGYTYKAPPTALPPEVTNITYTKQATGYLTYVDGANFDSGVTAILNGVEYPTLNYYGPTRFRVRFTVPAGTYTLVVRNGDGQESAPVQVTFN